MQITLTITEDSKVALVKEDCELLQGECCFTDFVFNFPETIKGHAISEYVKFIEFAECKEIGECVKFVDEIKGDTYELNEMCTAFKKIMVQLSLERNRDGKMIVWKTIPFSLEFVESINANGDNAIHTQLLHLTEIRDKWQKDFEDTKDEWHKDLVDTKDAWAAFIKADCLRMVYSSAGVALANEESNGDTIFYLGENNGDFTYGHYYRCTEIGGVYSWKDLTQDPSLEDVANGIREINKNRTVQMFIGTEEEIANAPHGENELIIAEDMDAVDELTEIIDDAGGKFGNFAIPRFDEKGFVEVGDAIIPHFDKNGVLHTMAGVRNVTVRVGGQLHSGDDLAAYEFYCDTLLLEGDKIYFDGEVGEVERYESEYGYYELFVPKNGKIAQQSGNTINVTIPISVIIPQKKLIASFPNEEEEGNFVLEKEVQRGTKIEFRHRQGAITGFVPNVVVAGLNGSISLGSTVETQYATKEEDGETEEILTSTFVELCMLEDMKTFFLIQSIQYVTGGASRSKLHPKDVKIYEIIE